MPKVCAHICMCGVRRDKLFEGENPFYISFLVGLATLYWILDCQITQKWRTLLWSDYNLHSLFSSKDRERKDKCWARVTDVHDFLVWEVGGCVTCKHYAAPLCEIHNEWVASNRILLFALRFLGSPRGKHCNSLEGIAWRKVVPMSKKKILERDYRFFAAPLSEMD